MFSSRKPSSDDWEKKSLPPVVKQRIVEKPRVQIWYPDLDSLMVALNLTEDDNETRSMSSLESFDFEDRRVRFGTVDVREYKVEKGDHPFCKDGLALSLGWEYTQAPSIEIEELDEEDDEGSDEEIDDNDSFDQESIDEEDFEDDRTDNIDYINTRPKRLNYFERRLVLEQVGYKVEDCYGDIRSSIWIGVDDELPPLEDEEDDDNFITPLTHLI